MAVNCILGQQSSFSFGSFQKQLTPRSRFPRISVRERVSTPITYTQTKVCCINGQGNTIASNMTYNEAVLKKARLGFSEEVAFTKQDQEVSLVKALLLISAEDEAFMSLNREKDRLAAHTEGRIVSDEQQSEACGADVEGFPISGRTMLTWLARFDFLAKEVEEILATKGSSLKPREVLKAVGTVLFEIQGFKKSVTDLDTRSFYLHLVLTLGTGSGVLLCIIYMDVCRRLGVTVKGAEVGDELFMWPLVDNLQECYDHDSGGKSLFLELLGFHHPKHLFGNLGPSTHGSFTSPTLKFASNKDIIGMVLSKLKNLHWKDACKARPGFTLTDPLHPLVYSDGRLTDHTELAVGALLRPRNLRLALMASERLRLLHPRSWTLMRDHGLLLYHSRRYGEAVQELSICAALAPTVESHMLEHFVEKLHLLRIESSWSSLRPPSAPSTLA